MKTFTIISFIAITLVFSAGCDSDDRIDDSPDSWVTHYDTMRIAMIDDSIKFTFYMRVYPPYPPDTPIVSVISDPSLSDTLRIEAALRSFLYSDSAIRYSSFTDHYSWRNDTLIVEYDHGSLQRRTCPWAPEGTKLISAKVFIPEGTKASYIGY